MCRSDVLVTGDIFNMTGYPLIDVDKEWGIGARPQFLRNRGLGLRQHHLNVIQSFADLVGERLAFNAEEYVLESPLGKFRTSAEGLP